MNPRTKIKVSRTALIEALTAKKTAMETDVAEQEAAFEGEAIRYQEEMVSFLEDLTDKAAAGHTVRLCNYRVTVDGVQVTEPEEPTKPYLGRDFNSLAASIAQLSMSPDETIAISVEDFGKYLGSTS